MANDKFEGTLKKAEGSIESAFGRASGDPTIEFKGKAKEAIGSAKEALEDAKDHMSEACESVSRHIKDKPVQSALIALGVGFLVARLLRA